jgi:hypothetical protein
MRRTRHWRLRAAGVLIGVLAAGVSGATVAASAAPVTHARLSVAASTVTQTGPVSSTAASGTPALLKHTSAVDTIRQLVQCGSDMYAVGKFTQIMWNGTTYDRNNIFSFSATKPYTVTSWNPGANGEVDSIALNAGCSHAYIGGDFTGAGHGSADHIANIRVPNGTLVNDWAHHINSRVNTIALTSTGHLLVGGTFTSVDGDTAHPYFASLSPSTGKDDGFLNLHISGSYRYCNSTGTKCATHFPTEVFNQQISHGGTLDLAEGVFTSVGGQPRQQIFMLNLATSPATLTGWTSPEWDGSKGNLPGGYPYQCKFTLPFYIRAAAWSPDDSTVYIATTGAEPYNWNGKFPLTGLCDVTAAFPATQASVLHTWVNYTGCDSLFTVAADDSAEYAAGHPRWMNNQNDCNAEGPGAVPSFGLQGRDPATGQPLLNSQGKALYSMSRANADDMLITSAGLWIASTNRFALDQCEHATGHAGICFLQYG